jgi:AcrR family transcriptional regulator
VTPETRTALTSDEILVAAEEVIRRYGPSKATVVDVARALGVSHGSVYRHFPSKAALRDAVTQRWLQRVAEPLDKIAASRAAPPKRLHTYLVTLMKAKRERALEDPEMFSNYMSLVEETDGAVSDHVNHLVANLTTIIRDGIESGAFVPWLDVREAARGVFDATAVFHNPAHAPEWRRPTIDAEFEGVWKLVLGGLTP